MEELDLDMYPKTLWNEAYTSELAKVNLTQSWGDGVYGQKQKRRASRSRSLGKVIPNIDALAAAELLKLFLMYHGKHGSESQPVFAFQDAAVNTFDD